MFENTFIFVPFVPVVIVIGSGTAGSFSNPVAFPRNSTLVPLRSAVPPFFVYTAYPSPEYLRTPSVRSTLLPVPTEAIPDAPSTTLIFAFCIFISEPVPAYTAIPFATLSCIPVSSVFISSVSDVVKGLNSTLFPLPVLYIPIVPFFPVILVVPVISVSFLLYIAAELPP